VEWLKYEFVDQTDNSATIAMSWEKRMIAFKVEADTKGLQIAAFKSDFRTTRPYYDYISAANYCIQNNVELEQALAWMDRAIYFRIMGEKNFRSLSTKAAVLTKMGRMDEAKKVMDEALPMGSVLDVHFYGRGLLNQNQSAEAFKVFKLNYDKNPNEFTTHIGMARGYSALADYKKAMNFLKTALPKAPDDGGKRNVEAMIKKLEEGKDINK
jgi:tetratricopeptide (TPR) repeat protein